MAELKIKYNELTAEQFIELWETVWGDGPTLEQTELAMKHTLFRVSIWDDDKIVAMARMNEPLKKVCKKTANCDKIEIITQEADFLW